MKKEKKKAIVKTMAVPQAQFVEVEPVLPTYHIEDVCLAQVVKQLLSLDSEVPNKLVIQTSGMSCCLVDEEEKGIYDFSSHPLFPDAVSDDSVYYLFETLDRDVEDTIRELANWGLTKVYLAPFIDLTVSVEEFLNGVQKHFLDKGNTYPTEAEKKKVVFMTKSAN